MTQGPALDEAEADAVAELFNIGMGPPAAALSEMLGQEVHVSVPAVSLTTRPEVAAGLDATLRDGAGLCAVCEEVRGPFPGEAMVVFEPAGGLALVASLLPGTDGLDDDARDALTEIGNILLNGCFASLANLIEGEVEGGVPECRIGAAGQVLGPSPDPVLAVVIDLRVNPAGHGRALFLFDVVALDAFREGVRRSIAALGL